MYQNWVSLLQAERQANEDPRHTPVVGSIPKQLRARQHRRERSLPCCAIARVKLTARVGRRIAESLSDTPS